MQGEDFVSMMFATMNRMMRKRENKVVLHKAIEMVIGTTNRVNGKEISRYLEVYKAKMLMRDIAEVKGLSSFARVVTPCPMQRSFR